MISLRLLCRLIAGLTTLLSMNLPATGEIPPDPTPTTTWQVTSDLEIRELQPGIWEHTSWYTFPSGIRYPSNGLIVVENDSVLLIDTAWGVTATEDLLDWIETELELPVSAVIATHSHDDRMGGAPVLAERGIPLFAHPLAVRFAISRGWPEPRSIGSLEAGSAAEFGAVEVFYPGAAHTVDNIMIWLPGARLLVGGCAVKSADATTLGNVADADLDEWPISINRVIEKYPDVGQVLPGHGAIGGRELLLHTTHLLEQTE